MTIQEFHKHLLELVVSQSKTDSLLKSANILSMDLSSCEHDPCLKEPEEKTTLKVIINLN
jgi:hypothetical protein